MEKNREILNEKLRVWSKNNPEKLKLYSSKQYIKDKEKICKRVREYRKRTNYDKLYRKTKKGKEVHLKSQAKRKRNLNWITIMENPFPEEVKIHYHHINDMITIPIPDKLHLSTLGKNHRLKCENIIKDIYGLDISNILSD
jgi:hypothetical protein